MFIVALAVYAAGAAAFLAFGGGAPVTEAHDGDFSVHDVAYVDLDGNAASLGAFAGRPVIINFFASTCEPCKLEMPDLERFHQANGADVALVGLAVEGARPARRTVEETGVTYATGLDPGDLIVDLGGVGLPTTVFISHRGEVLESHTGLLTYEQIVDKVAELFAA